MTAIISDCGRYRSTLERSLGQDGPTVLFMGVNPSKADARINDQTVRKWMGFGQRWGAGHMVVGNVFDYRATDVTELSRVPHPVSPMNWVHLANLLARADFAVPCWGARGKLPEHLRPHLDRMLCWLRESGVPLFHLGLTSSGDPKHPLTLGYDTPLTFWP